MDPKTESSARKTTFGPPAGEWRIAETNRRCARCSRPFLAEDRFVSLLLFEGGEALPRLIRVDHCLSCWENRREELREDGPGPIYWVTRRRPGAREEHLVDLGSLERLFLDLLERKEEEYAALCYVVGLLLFRKKILKRVRGAQGARGDLIFKDPRDEEGKRILRIPAPDFTPEVLEDLKERLGDILGA